MSKAKKYLPPILKLIRAEEVSQPPIAVKKELLIAEYSFKKFKKLTDLMPFTQSEWASMLHLSERTLQRYAKSNASFEAIYTDRILLLQKMIRLGLETFVSAEVFYQWLKKEKQVMGHSIGFSSLLSEKGIQEIIDQIGRIQYGIYA
jgi:putative toxin-antitoxin system antitoxin component (TIGR02293 family)